ncbi:MAG: hypothetical protein R3D02_14625 [Hyphomicrobiales bacterium]
MASNFHEDFSERAVAMPSERSTGLVLAGAAAIGAWLFWPATLPSAILTGSAVTLGILAIGAPSLLKTVNLLWFRLSLLLNRIVAPVVMGLLYYLVITPFGLVMQRRRDRCAIAATRPSPPTGWRRTPASAR